jgi:hypothetical protein
VGAVNHQVEENTGPFQDLNTPGPKIQKCSNVVHEEVGLLGLCAQLLTSHVAIAID